MSGYRILVAIASGTALAGASWFAQAQANTRAAAVVSSSAKAELRVARSGAGQRMNRLIVQFKNTVDSDKNGAMQLASAQERVQSLNTFALSSRAGGATLSYLKSVSANTHVAQTSAPMDYAALRALAQTLAQDPRVEYAEVDERVFSHFVPNDTFYAAQQGNLQSPFVQAGGANLPNAWGRSVGGVPVSGSGVTVAVLDSGYRPHADLVANIVAGYDFVSQDGVADFTTANDGDGRDANALDPGDWNSQKDLCDVENSSWHGTHVAGIIGAVGNNNAGVIGVAYRAKVLPVRVLGVCGGYTSDTAAALQWAAGLAVPGVPANANPAKVINMSFGRSGACSVTYQNAVRAVTTAGTLIVVSTGNDGSTDAITQPSNCPGVMAVTAHTSTGANTDYANVGAGTLISAPGNSIYSLSNTGTTVPGADNFIARTGTSFSAPQVAGVAALLAQIKPGITPAEIITHITTSARPYAAGTYCVGRPECGAGLLDAFKAVYSVLQSQGVANAAPLMAALPQQYVLPGGALQFTATASDADGDAVAFIGSGLPAGATFNAVTGVFSWPKAQPAGDYNFVIQPTDGATLGASITVKISVTTAIPVAPVAPVEPTPPAVTPTPPLTLTPITNSGGGGGGAMGWMDMVAGLLLLAASAWVRRTAPPQPTRS
ncbi:S8 family peptidase [Rhodoferax sp. AJA081-3]|uniref:S8 family serine peptidase n=1 Tax=Rhodoferax sp. AJA081-3 TaxID=2752316 RepID=UPI001AE0207B|nr:S8 family serine peptidase [Rhodoferax sp. AJA081-3]QTN29773.1 S8 family peptidase [Rhodoferax sp. AJA081-3]